MSESEAASPSPSEIIRQRASKIGWTTDAFGRKIGMRWLGPLQRVALARLVGNADQGNAEVAMHYAAAYAVAHIDSETYPAPQNLGELDMMLQRLDEEGVMAVVIHQAKQRAAAAKSLDATAEEAKESLKNS